jgi:hypothetical protein
LKGFFKATILFYNFSVGKTNFLKMRVSENGNPAGLIKGIMDLSLIIPNLDNI